MGEAPDQDKSTGRRAWIRTAPRRFGRWCAVLAERWLGRLERTYHWIIIAIALIAYAAVWYYITWEIPFIADRTLDLLRAATGTGDDEAIRNYAYALGALLGGIALLATVPFQLIKTWVNERTARTVEQGHITDRLTRAIEQLGAEKTIKFRVRSYEYDVPTGEQSVPVEKNQRSGEDPDVPSDAENLRFGDWQTHDETVANLEIRLGAIYALERIAEDSPRDHITVMEVLCAYIRNNAPASEAADHDLGEWPRFDELSEENPTNRLPYAIEERRVVLEGWIAGLKAPRIDIQAALTVIGRRAPDRIELERTAPRPFRLDLRNTCLQRADLSGLNFDHARFDGARIDGADLSDSSLAKADFSVASLQCAELERAVVDDGSFFRTRLEGARLSNVHGERARFISATLPWVDLTAANLAGTSFLFASLQGAQAQGALLSGAIIRESDLCSADLNRTNLLGLNLLRSELWYARFAGAKLDDGSLSGASIRGADLSECELTQSRIDGAFGDTETVLPPDLVRPVHWDTSVVPLRGQDKRFESWLADTSRKDGSGARRQ